MKLVSSRMRRVAQKRRWIMVPLVLVLSACSMPTLKPPTEVKPSNVNADATLTPATRITRDLVKLPAPMFKVPVAVYAFRDQTGQFRAQPESNLSNSVTQGAAAILVKALLDSGWYLPIEREGFQNLLNERRVARAIEVPADKGKPGTSYPQLVPAQFIMEGGIVGYESNVRTGGVGANLLGVGAETKYRIDQVTVNLRSIDVRTGQVVNSVSVTKTIFSHEISSSIYKFVAYKELLQGEGGYSSNEPSQLAVKEAIESAVIHLTAQGIADRAWALKNEQDWYSPVLQSYLRDSELQLAPPEASAPATDATVARRQASLVRPAELPVHMMQPPPAPDSGAVPPANATSPSVPRAPAAPATAAAGAPNAATKPASAAGAAAPDTRVIASTPPPTPAPTAPTPTPAARPAVALMSAPKLIAAPLLAPRQINLPEPNDEALLAPEFDNDAR